mgnify:CR=1 FL=1
MTASMERRVVGTFGAEPAGPTSLVMVARVSTSSTAFDSASSAATSSAGDEARMNCERDEI